MFDRNQWISKMALNRMYFDRFTDTVGSAFSDLINGMEAKYCKYAFECARSLHRSIALTPSRSSFAGQRS